MKRQPKIQTSPRKAPVQERSKHLVDAILEAAIRVLEREGAQRFTTIRVAEEAGVSVGSLYQYFPNKQSILHRLQLDEWQETGSLLDALSSDPSRSVDERLRATMRAFFESECAEASLRRALTDAAPAYRDAPESHAHRERGRRTVRAFVRSAAPHATPKQRALAAEIALHTMSALGKQVSEEPRSKAEVRAWADATSEMLGGYLARLRPRAR